MLALPAVQDWLDGHAFLAAFAWSLVALASLANQIHQWAHAPARRRAGCGALQRAGAILSPARHARHHRAPFDGDYCITGGWLNRPSTRWDSGARSSARVTRATGAAPRSERRRYRQPAPLARARTDR